MKEYAIGEFKRDRFFFSIFFLYFSQLPEQAYSMLVMDEVVILNELRKVEGLVDLFSSDNCFFGS